jgi:hypothetical protein
MRKRNGDIAVDAYRMIAGEVVASLELLFCPLFWKATEITRYPAEMPPEFWFCWLMKLTLDWTLESKGREDPTVLLAPCPEIIM